MIKFLDRPHETKRLKEPLLREQLAFLLNSPKVKMKGANFKYDLHWFHVRAKMACSNFVFDTIVGSLLDENRSNSLNTHVKIYVPALAGYDDCVSPDTLILTSGLKKIRADQLKIGDELCAFTVESPDGLKAQRRVMQRSFVTATQQIVRPCLKIITQSGRETVVSKGHLFPVKERTAR